MVICMITVTITVTASMDTGMGTTGMGTRIISSATCWGSIMTRITAKGMEKDTVTTTRAGRRLRNLPFGPVLCRGCE